MKKCTYIHTSTLVDVVFQTFIYSILDKVWCGLNIFEEAEAAWVREGITPKYIFN